MSQAFDIVWQPHPGPQTEFMLASEFEVLYGGAAGGGKSDALVVDILGLNGTNLVTGELMHSISHPKYRGIILRQNYTDLKQIIDRCNELYPTIVPGTRYAKGDKQFIFPSGARIELGHVAEAGDELRYKSREFQYVGWEELTEHPSEDAYRYLMSRCRGPKELAKYIRATTNPDGPGHSWVKKRFRIPDSGAAVPAFGIRYKIRDRVVVRARRFIPARVTDNPSMDEGYEVNLHMMSEQEIKALYEGRWDIVNIKGVILKEQIERAIKEGRITKVPYDSGYPVNTFWDVGVNDRMAIWFHQNIGYQNRFIGYFEDAHQPLDHYYEELKVRDYRYGVHYLPHDAGHRKLGAHDVRSVQEMLEDLGVKPTEVVGRVESIRVGIEAMRQAFSSCVFDEHECAEGLEALKNYRYRIDAKTQTSTRVPLHDWASNGADAFRQFAQGFHASQGNHGEPPESEQPGGLRSYKRKRREPLNVYDPRDNDWVV